MLVTHRSDSNSLNTPVKNARTVELKSPRAQVQLKDVSTLRGSVFSKAPKHQDLRDGVKRRLQHVRFFFDERPKRVKRKARVQLHPLKQNPGGALVPHKGPLPDALSGIKTSDGYLDLNKITPLMLENMFASERQQFISGLAGRKVMDGSLNPPTALSVVLDRVSSQDGKGSTLSMVASLLPPGEEVSDGIARRLVGDLPGFVSSLKTANGGSLTSHAQELLNDVATKYIQSQPSIEAGAVNFLQRGRDAVVDHGGSTWGSLVSSALTGLNRVAGV